MGKGLDDLSGKEEKKRKRTLRMALKDQQAATSCDCSAAHTNTSQCSVLSEAFISL